MNYHVVVFDLETTGLNAQVHQIAEVGLIRLTPDLKTELSRYSSKVYIEDLSKAHPRALRTFGYSPEAWSDAPPLNVVMSIVWGMCYGAIPMGYNVQFDIRFANATFSRLGMQRPWAGEWYYDVMKEVAPYKKAGEIENKGLGTAASYFLGRRQSESHRALEDVELTLELERYFRAKACIQGI